jgi:hypothetical protein
VLAAQQAWGDGIVAISSAYANGQDFEQVATDHIQTLYGYGMTTVLFKPTLAAEDQFRSDFEGALSYFVATNNASEEDSGFAIKGWTAVRFENDDIILSGNTASAMGNYFFTGPDGAETKVEYSFGYFLDADDHLRINLHHSSMPYVAPTPVPTLEPTAPPCEDDDDQMVALAASQGQTISGCAEVASFCSNPTLGSFVQAACPVSCGSCPCVDDDDQMVALAASQGQTISGCAQVASFCSSPTFGSFVQEACPVTCDSCTRRLADMKHSYANDLDRIEELTVVAPAAEVWQRIHEFGNSGTDAFYP